MGNTGLCNRNLLQFYIFNNKSYTCAQFQELKRVFVFSFTPFQNHLIHFEKPKTYIQGKICPLKKIEIEPIINEKIFQFI
jgi:hypothetical protein